MKQRDFIEELDSLSDAPIERENAQGIYGKFQNLWDELQPSSVFVDNLRADLQASRQQANLRQINYMMGALVVFFISINFIAYFTLSSGKTENSGMERESTQEIIELQEMQKEDFGSSDMMMRTMIVDETLGDEDEVMLQAEDSRGIYEMQMEEFYTACEGSNGTVMDDDYTCDFGDENYCEFDTLLEGAAEPCEFLNK